MIVCFSVENYKSIYKKLDLSFEAESLKQHAGNLIETDFPKLNLLKALAIYGANSSGKTNMIMAMTFMRDFVLSSSQNSAIPGKIEVEPYQLLLKSQKEPSKFEMDFIVNENRYKYGFTINTKEVIEEHLHLVLKTTEKSLFERNRESIELNNSFSEGFGKDSFVRPNTLFLSTLAQLNASISSQIVEWFRNFSIITDYNYASFTSYTATLLNDSKYGSMLRRMFSAANIDLEDAHVKLVNIDDNLMQFLSLELRDILKKNLPQQYQVFSHHNVYNLKDEIVDQVEFDLKRASAGTQKFFAIAGPIVYSLYNSYPVIIDELDARLHYLIVKYLIKLFCSEHDNPHGGQLIFSTHMLDIMDRELLRRDQILLMTKSRQGSEITSIQKQGARSDTSFIRDYLSGSFGTLPDTEANQIPLF